MPAIYFLRTALHGFFQYFVSLNGSADAPSEPRKVSQLGFLEGLC